MHCFRFLVSYSASPNNKKKVLHNPGAIVFNVVKYLNGLKLIRHELLPNTVGCTLRALRHGLSGADVDLNLSV